MNIYPAILTGSIQDAQSETMWISSVVKIRTVQIDIIDGLFADNVTLTPVDLPSIDFGELTCDLHLMTEEPLDFVYEAIDCKEDIPIRALIAQVERMSRQEDFVQTVRANGWQVGLSLDLYTPIEEIDLESWQAIDIVQLMAIEAGFQGQAFSEIVYEKVQAVKAMSQKIERDIEIIVDGGIKPAHMARLEKKGANSVAIGSGLWNADDVLSAVEAYSGD